MNFDVADDCRGAFQRAGGIFLSPETAFIHPASQRGCGWFDGQSIQTDLCPVKILKNSNQTGEEHGSA
jgi:hypothetical protein